MVNTLSLSMPTDVLVAILGFLDSLQLWRLSACVSKEFSQLIKEGSISLVQTRTALSIERLNIWRDKTITIASDYDSFEQRSVLEAWGRKFEPALMHSICAGDEFHLTAILEWGQLQDLDIARWRLCCDKRRELLAAAAEQGTENCVQLLVSAGAEYPKITRLPLGYRHHRRSDSFFANREVQLKGDKPSMSVLWYACRYQFCPLLVRQLLERREEASTAVTPPTVMEEPPTRCPLLAAIHFRCAPVVVALLLEYAVGEGQVLPHPSANDRTANATARNGSTMHLELEDELQLDLVTSLLCLDPNLQHHHTLEASGPHVRAGGSSLTAQEGGQDDGMPISDTWSTSALEVSEHKCNSIGKVLL
jgi:hypothetical protein